MSPFSFLLCKFILICSHFDLTWKKFYQNELNLKCHSLCFEPRCKPSHFCLKALDEKMCWCISKPTSLENTFEEIYCAKYLRMILLITYLFLCGYDCTNSTLTNMNEWIHEETRLMCYMPHQKSKALIHFFLNSTVFQVPGICSLGWNINHSASPWKKNWFWSLSVCDTAKHTSREQNNSIH